MELKFKKIIWQSFLVIVLFLFFYDTSFKFLPTLLSGRKIAIIIFALIALLKNREIILSGFKSVKNVILPIAIITGVSIIVVTINLLYRFGSLSIQENQLGANIYYLIFFCIGLFLMYVVFKDDIEFVTCLSYAHICQAIFIYISLFFPKFRDFVADILHQLGNLALNTDARIIGFSNSGGSSVSLLLFSGMVCIGYLILKRQKSSLKMLAMYIFILMSAFFVGKTGFYLGLGLLIYICIEIIISQKVNVQKVIIYFGISVIIFIIFIIILKVVAPETLRKSTKLAFSLIRNGLSDPSITSLINMDIPLRGIDLLFGTGLYRGVTNTGIILKHDSGYVRSIFSIGLIMTTLFYGSHLYIMINENKKTIKTLKRYLFLIIAIIFFVEIKEAFFFKIYIQMIPLLIILLMNKEQRN